MAQNTRSGGGRTLIDGTVYEIGFERQVTYVIERFKSNPQFKQYINFTSNGMSFVAFQVLDIYLLYERPDGTMYYAYNSYRWTNEAWKTVTFEEKPTGDLLTWLQANAVQQ